MTRRACTGGYPFTCLDVGGLCTAPHHGKNEGQSEHFFADLLHTLAEHHHQ